MEILVVAEQLRRAVPGGIGTYTSGLFQGLAGLTGAGEPDVVLTLLASRPPAGGDPLCRFGFPVRTVALPGPLMTRAWDRDRLGVPPGFAAVHAVSLASPPPGSTPLTV
ncbi:MAG TPA: hypothetical protein VF954_02330, partial [Acidimicrobiales bacterium]